MPKVNVYLPDELAAAVREANIPVSAVCQAALERAVRDITAARSADDAPTGQLPSVGLYGRFTPRARGAVSLAQAAARDGGQQEVGTEHVLLGILDQRDNLALVVLADLDIDRDDLRAELLASIAPGGGHQLEPHLPFSAHSKRALELATKEAVGLGHNYLGCEHLLLGVLATEDGLGSKVLRRLGVELRTTRRAVTAALHTLITANPNLVTKPVPAAAPEPTLEKILERLDAIERRLPPEA